MSASATCKCEPRNRRWNFFSRICEFCGRRFKDERRLQPKDEDQ